MPALRHIVHTFLLICIAICVLVGAIVPAGVMAVVTTYLFRAYGVVGILILVDGVLGAFYSIPWLSGIGISWLIVSELVRPLLIISNQDTV